MTVSWKYGTTCLHSLKGDGKGGYTELSQKNIDTGMGLERLAVVMQDVDSVFDIDTMKAIRDKICEMSGKKYEVDAMDDVSIRLITDHIRFFHISCIRWCYAKQ